MKVAVLSALLIIGAAVALTQTERVTSEGKVFPSLKLVFGQ